LQYGDSIDDVGVAYNAAGADNVWLTSDDTVRSYSDRDDDANGNPLRRTYYNAAGADNVWFTADDVVKNYEDSSYDVNQHQLQSNFYDAAGADVIWFTGDDTLGATTTFNPSL